nr:MAG TPA: Protein of unknown function (DUF551) [Caudoviricetes sp.]
MTSEEIVKALRHCKFGEPCDRCPVVSDQNCVDVMHKCAADLIERLTAENVALREKRLWQPVLTGNPERKACYLVTVLHWLDGLPVVREAFWNGVDWLSCERRHEITPRVTHWMPLPEAPEKGEKA